MRRAASDATSGDGRFGGRGVEMKDIIAPWRVNNVARGVEDKQLCTG